MAAAVVKIFIFLCLAFRLQETISASTATILKTPDTSSGTPIDGDYEMDDESKYWVHLEHIKDRIKEKETLFLSVIEKVKSVKFDDTKIHLRAVQLEECVLNFIRICKEDSPEKRVLFKDREPSYAYLLVRDFFMTYLASVGPVFLSTSDGQVEMAVSLICFYSKAEEELLLNFIDDNDALNVSVLLRDGVSATPKSHTLFRHTTLTSTDFLRRKEQVMSEQPNNFLRSIMEDGYSLIERGNYPLAMAVAIGHIEVAKVLLSNANAYENSYVMEIAFCLHLLHTDAFSTFSELREEFLKYVRTKTDNGLNILAMAAVSGHVHAVLILRDYVSFSHKKNAVEMFEEAVSRNNDTTLQSYPVSEGVCMEEPDPMIYDPTRIKDIFDESIVASEAIKDQSLSLNCFVDGKSFYVPAWHSQDGEWAWKKYGLEIIYPTGFLEKYHASLAAKDTGSGKSWYPTKVATRKEHHEDATQSGENWVSYSDLLSQFERNHGIIDVGCDSIIAEALNLSLSSYSDDSSSSSTSSLSASVRSLPDTSFFFRVLEHPEKFTINMLMFSLAFANFASENSEESVKVTIKLLIKNLIKKMISQYSQLTDAQLKNEDIIEEIDIPGISALLYKFLYFFMKEFNQEDLNQILDILVKAGNRNFLFLGTLIFKLNSMSVIQELQAKDPPLHRAMFQFGLVHKFFCLLEEIIDKNEKGFIDFVGEKLNLKEDIIISPDSDHMTQEGLHRHVWCILRRCDAATRSGYDSDSIATFVHRFEKELNDLPGRNLNPLEYSVAILDINLINFLGRKGAATFDFELLFRIGAPFNAKSGERSRDALLLNIVSGLLAHNNVASQFYKLGTSFIADFPGLQESIVTSKAVEQWLMIVLLNGDDDISNEESLRRVQHLRMIGVDLSKQIFLHLAVLGGDIGVIENLLTPDAPKGNRVEINMFNEKMETALDLANFLWHQEKIKDPVQLMEVENRERVVNVLLANNAIKSSEKKQQLISEYKLYHNELEENKVKLAKIEEQIKKEKIKRGRKKKKKVGNSELSRRRDLVQGKIKYLLNQIQEMDNSELKYLTSGESFSDSGRQVMKTSQPEMEEGFVPDDMSIAERSLLQKRNDLGNQFEEKSKDTTEQGDEEMQGLADIFEDASEALEGIKGVPELDKVQSVAKLNHGSEVQGSDPEKYLAHELNTLFYSGLIPELNKIYGRNIDAIIDNLETRDTVHEIEEIDSILFRDPRMAKILQNRLATLTRCLVANSISHEKSSVSTLKHQRVTNLLQEAASETKNAYRRFLQKPLNVHPPMAEPEPAGISGESILCSDHASTGISGSVRVVDCTGNPESASNSSAINAAYRSKQPDDIEETDYILQRRLQLRIKACQESIKNVESMKSILRAVSPAAGQEEPFAIEYQERGKFKCFLATEEIETHLLSISLVEKREKELLQVYREKEVSYNAELKMYNFSPNVDSLFKLIRANDVDKLGRFIDTMGLFTGKSLIPGVWALIVALNNDLVEVGKMIFSKNKALANMYQDLTGEHLLCMEKDISMEFAKLILEHTDIFKRNIDGSNILSDCVVHNREDLMKLIISTIKSKGSEKILVEMMNSQEMMGRSILSTAALHPAMLKLFLQNHAAGSINYRALNDGRTALHKASEIGNLSSVKILAEAGTDVFAENFFGFTALDFAKTDEIRTVLKYIMLQAPWPIPKMDILEDDENEDSDSSLLHKLSSSTNFVFLSFGFQRFICAVIKDVLEKEKFGGSAGEINNFLAEAESLSHSGGSLLRPLLQQEEKRNILRNIKCPCKISGDVQMELPILSIFALNGRASLIEMLLDNGFEDFVDANNGTSALYFALKSNHERATEKLLSRSTEQLVQAEFGGFTPLLFASVNGWPNIVRVLLKKGANVNDSFEGMNALMYALELDDKELARIIIKLLFDADIDLSTEYPGKQTTVLNHCLIQKNIESARVLIEFGNSKTLNIKDVKGYTPLMACAAHGVSELIQPLIKKGANPNSWALERKSDSEIVTCNSLGVAIIREHFDIAKILIANGVTTEDVLSEYGGVTVDCWLWVKLYEIFERTLVFDWSRVADDAEDDDCSGDEQVLEDLSKFDDEYEPEFVRYYGDDPSDKSSGTPTKPEASFRGKHAAAGDGDGKYSDMKKSAPGLSDIKRTLFVYESVEKWRRNHRNKHLLKRFAKHLNYIATGEVRAGYKTLSGFTGVLGNKLWEAPLTGKQRILFEFPEILSDGSISPGHIWDVTMGHDGGNGIAKHALKLALNPHLKHYASDRTTKEDKLDAKFDESNPGVSLPTKTYGKGELKKYELNSYHRGYIDWKEQLDERDWNIYQELSDEELTYVKKRGFLELIGPPGTGKTDIMRFRMILNANMAVGQDHFLKLNKIQQNTSTGDHAAVAVSPVGDAVNIGVELDIVTVTAEPEPYATQPEPYAEEDQLRIRQVFIAKSFNLCNRVRRQMPNVYLDDTLTTMMFLPVSPSAGYNSRGVIRSSFIEYIEEQASGEMSRALSNALGNTKKYLQYEMFEKRYESHTKATRRHTHTELQGDCALSADIVWTEIQMNIKGSLLSFQKGRPLTQKEYKNLNTSKRSIQFTPRQKTSIYKVYERYEAFKYSEEFDSRKVDVMIWHDEMDRILDIIRRLSVQKEHFPFVRVHGPNNKMWKSGRHPFDTIFIDEVQDLPPMIVALARCVVGGNPDAISVAGDLAQQITPGISFDFKYVHDVIALDEHATKTVGFSALSKQGQNILLFNNYRTHNNIVKATKLFVRLQQEHFRLPVSRSDISLTTNRTGPTPKVWLTDTEELIDELSPGNTLLFRNEEAMKRFSTRFEQKILDLEKHVSLLNARKKTEDITPEYYDEKMKLLTSDLEVSKSRLEKVQKYPMLSILEAKGLDFKRVVLVDFFSSAETKYCKLYRSLFQGNNLDGVFRGNPGLYDGLRNEIRYLYVATTRSITELYIVETLENECQKYAFQFLTSATNSPKSVDKLFQSYAPTKKGPKGSLYTLRISSSELVRQGSHLMTMALEGNQRIEASHNYMAQAKKMFVLAKRQDLSDQVDKVLSCDSFPEDIDEEIFLVYIENCLEAGFYAKVLDGLRQRSFVLSKYFVEKVEDKMRKLK